ncbi:MAG: hypothetical protein J5800_00465 [Spirochaetales bacterium]|nr:hypothetical protein [Spirochaetales bacterium]
MREFDHNGLLLSEFQGKLFEKSVELSCSSGIFLRRFLHSDLLKRMDTNNAASVSLDVSEGMRSIRMQFGDTDYGKEHFPGNVMFWMGYMYRFISYTRETSTGFIMKLFNYRQMRDVYYPFHTQDPEWCISRLLDLNNATEEVFDRNIRLKEAMRRKMQL